MGDNSNAGAAAGGGAIVIFQGLFWPAFMVY
jgi:hypothetical protein